MADLASGCIAAMLNGSGGDVLKLVTGVDTTRTDLAHAVLETCGLNDL